MLKGVCQCPVQSGFMYGDGPRVAQDYKAAVKWSKLAAEQEHANAQLFLGKMYANGLGVTQDYARAYMWWDNAASKGNEDAAKRIINVENIMTPSDISKAQELTSNG